MQPLMRPLVAMEAPVPRLQLLAHEAGVETFHRIGGLWLFGESFDRDAAAVPEDAAVTDDLLRAGHEACNALVRAARAEGISPPSRYYGVLLLDGDKMGAWLSGERRPTEDMTVDRAYHQAVSRALGHFAGSLVPPLVETSYLGQLVYSGGDDVMAFCSRLDTLPLARALRAAFSSHLSPQGQVDWTRDRPFTPLSETDEPTLGHTASASAGVVIAHHMYPLSEVLREGRRAEKKEAKDALGRDALAVSVLKRGGQRETAGGRWRAGDLDLVPTLEHYASYLRSGDISTGFLHTLGTELDALSTMETHHAEAVHLEVRRLFARQSEKEATSFMPLLERLIDHHGLEKTVDLLALAQFIARGELT